MCIRDRHYIDTYKKDDFNLLLSKLDRQEEVLKEAYGVGKREKYKDYRQNKIDDLYKRIGNSFLSEIDVYKRQHRIINSNNPTAVEYLIGFQREARKYFGGLIFATQSRRDIAPSNLNNEMFEKIKTMFDLTQSKFIMQQDSNALDTLSNVFNGQLSDSEL